MRRTTAAPGGRSVLKKKKKKLFAVTRMDGTDRTVATARAPEVFKAPCRRCSPERPCKHGEGTCLDDSDCEGDGFHFCYLNCIDRYKCLLVYIFNPCSSGPGILWWSIQTIQRTWYASRIKPKSNSTTYRLDPILYLPTILL